MTLADARRLLDQRRVADAEAMLSRSIAAQPDDLELRLAYADAAKQSGQERVAAERLRDALTVAPESEFTHLALAESLARAGAIVDAIAVLSAARERFAQSPWPDIVRGRIALIDGDPGEAKRSAELALGATGVDASAHAGAAGVVLDAGNGERAREIISAALVRFPRDRTLLAMAATVYRALRRWPETIATCVALTDSYPEETAAYRWLSEALDADETIVRRDIVVFGNCQAEFWCALFALIPAIAHRYRFVPLSATPPPGQPVVIPAEIDKAAAFWQQITLGAQQPLRDEALQRVPQDAFRLAFPHVGMTCLWPFAWPGRQTPEPGFPWGRYPWGDRIGEEIAALHLPADEAFERYMTQSRRKMPNVHNLFERELHLLKQRDAASDFGMHDFVREHMRTEQLFWTWGHLGGPLIADMAGNMVKSGAALFDYDLALLEKQAAVAASMFAAQSHEQLPIHPDVIDAFGLTFVDRDSRYDWFGNQWTFDEYMKRYLTDDRDWDGAF